MSEPLELQAQRPYALDQLTMLQSQIMQTIQGMVVLRARIEKQRRSNIEAARDTYTELDRARGRLIEQLSKADLGSAQKIGDTQVYSAVVDGSDPELLAHGVWHILMQKGTPVPDCGIYYAALHRASATEEEKCEVLDHVGKYAVCMVTLSQGVKESA